MANSTDPFGKQMFGGQTSLGVPGGTSAVAPTTAAKKTNPYQYAGQGWNDPLAQQMYQKYTFGGRGDPGTVGKLASDANRQRDVGMQNMSYNTPIDPSTWGGAYRGDDVDAMKAAYVAAGGQGTYEQQAAYPGATNWPMDASGNPLPRLNMTTGKPESIVPGAPPPGVGSGSSASLSPDILQKMWR